MGKDKPPQASIDGTYSKKPKVSEKKGEKTRAPLFVFFSDLLRSISVLKHDDLPRQARDKRNIEKKTQKKEMPFRFVFVF